MHLVGKEGNDTPWRKKTARDAPLEKQGASIRKKGLDICAFRKRKWITLSCSLSVVKGAALIHEDKALFVKNSSSIHETKTSMSFLIVRESNPVLRNKLGSCLSRVFANENSKLVLRFSLFDKQRQPATTIRLPIGFTHNSKIDWTSLLLWVAFT